MTDESQFNTEATEKKQFNTEITEITEGGKARSESRKSDGKGDSSTPISFPIDSVSSVISVLN